MTATPRFHRPPPVEGVISLYPLFRGGIKGGGVVCHPPVSHDCHPPVSPSPSGGGGYQPTPRFHRPPPVEGVILHTITPSLEGESKGVVLYAPPGFT